MTEHETFLLLAAQQVGGPLPPDEAARLEAHLASCPSCRSIAAGMRWDDIRLRAELGPATVSPRVRRRVLDEAAGRRYLDPRLILGLAAVLALGAIGVPLLAGSRLSSAPSPSVEPPAAVAPTSSLAPSLSPPSPGIASPVAGPFVAGAYEYGTSPPRSGTVAAHFEGGAVGEWSRTFPNTDAGESYGGPVTCLVISGSDAWLAGPATTAPDGSTDLAALIYVHDGGPDGSGDMAMTWMTQPGQTLATVTTWCQDQFTPASPFDLTSGDVVVQGAP